MPRTTTLPVNARGQIALTAQGLITENFPRQSCVDGGSLMFDGTAYFLAVGLRAGDVATSVSFAVWGAGNTVTLSKVGLYSKAGTRLAISADQGTGWQSTGLKTVAFASPYTVPADDGYYVAIIAKASVTLPSLFVMGLNPGLNTVIGSGMASMGAQTAQTDLPASATITVGSGAPRGWWVGVS